MLRTRPRRWKRNIYPPIISHQWKMSLFGANYKTSQTWILRGFLGDSLTSATFFWVFVSDFYGTCPPWPSKKKHDELGFACLDAWKTSSQKTSSQNGALIVMNPMVQSLSNSPKNKQKLDIRILKPPASQIFFDRESQSPSAVRKCFTTAPEKKNNNGEKTPKSQRVISGWFLRK